MASKNVGSTTPSSSKSWRGGGGEGVGMAMAGTNDGGSSGIPHGGISAKTYPPPVRASSSAQHQQHFPHYSVVTKGHRGGGDPTTPGHSKAHLRQSQNDITSFVPPPPPSSIQAGHQHHHGKHHQHAPGSSRQRWPSGGAAVANHSGSGGGGAGSAGRSVLGATSALPGAGGDIENIDTCSRNPLFCLVCNNVFEDPRLLSCYHSFCAKCLDGRIGDTKITCPLCG